MKSLAIHLLIYFILLLVLGCTGRTSVDPFLGGSFFNIDTTGRESNIPLYDGMYQWNGSAWRGERISTQLLVWSEESINDVRISVSDLSGTDNSRITADHLNISSIGYVMTDEFAEGCEKTGYRNYDSSLVADILDPLIMPFNLQPRFPQLVWISLDVPHHATPGVYKGVIRVLTKRNKGLDFKLEIEVLAAGLPPPSDWEYHLDLWQNPFAVARYFNIVPWSEEHFELMRPTMKMLAEAGQKCITTSITDWPWAGQTYDPFESMVKKTRKPDGTWVYDYSVFDAWVDFAMKCGINSQINCYSMVSWSNVYSYFDETLDRDTTVSCRPGSKAYEQIWAPFLKDFSEHLEDNNWHSITAISMDERSLDDLKEVISLVGREASGLRIAFAGRYHPELDDVLDDLSVASKHIVPPDNLARRRENGFKTTFYVCCVEQQPNTFTFSPPAEATYLGWYAANRQFDGMLRWSYNSWTREPIKDSRFRRFPAGDTYIVYPGGRSSVRFERLREGIQDYEKIRHLLETFKQEQTDENEIKMRILKNQLHKFDIAGLDSIPASVDVAEGKDLLYQLSR